MLERRKVLFVVQLVLNECVGELVVEGLGLGLAGEHCAEVRPALTHDRLEADHGGALECHPMCLEEAENPMMYVLWWVNIGGSKRHVAQTPGK